MAQQETAPRTLTATEENALALSQAALLLDNARSERTPNVGADGSEPTRLTAALRHNAELWIGIQTLVKRANGALAPEVKANLQRLGDFVIGITLRDGESMPDETVDTLININLQISEGLLQASTH